MFNILHTPNSPPASATPAYQIVADDLAASSATKRRFLTNIIARYDWRLYIEGLLEEIHRNKRCCGFY